MNEERQPEASAPLLPPAPESIPDPRGRLLAAMAIVLSEKDFASTTVADVVKVARVSRRTFYEHFDDRGECFLALGDMITAHLLSLIDEAAALDLSWRERVDLSITAYLEAMSQNPSLTRSFVLEQFALGERGLARRRRAQRLAAQQLVDLVEREREREPSLNPMTLETAAAIIGGLWELSLLQVEEGHEGEMTRMRETAVQLITDTLTAPRD